MPSTLTVVVVSLLLVVLLLQTVANIWFGVVFLRARMPELRSNECWCDPGSHHIGSSKPSLTKPSLKFRKYSQKSHY
jgi:hypothetical protein